MSAASKAPVDFGSAALAVEHAQLEGRLGVLESQVSQSIQNLTGSFQAMQADVQRIADRNSENNTLLHELRERSTGLERIANAVEAAGKDHAGDTRAVSIELAKMKGFIWGISLCGGLALAAVSGFVVYRMDRTDDNVQDVRDAIQRYHPLGGQTK